MRQADIKEVKAIPLGDLVIGKAQVRVRDVGKDIEELAASIAKVGLLEPIVVCPARESGKYEILTGQRRYLAHKRLNKETILACVLEHEVDETEAKVISITENLVRNKLHTRDLIDACTALYRQYGSMKAVSDETGLPYDKVRLYVKYDRLSKALKELVDSGEVDLKVAIRAHDAASIGDSYDPEEAVMLAKELAGMSGAQQKRVVKNRKDDPTSDVTDIIEEAKTGKQITQIVVTVSKTLHSSLGKYAKEEKTTIDDAASTLIEEALMDKGFSSLE